MRAMLTSAVLAISTFTLPAYADQTLPARKAGLWELKTTMDEGNGPRDQTLKICIDDRMEANTIAASIADHKEKCTRYDIKSEAGVTTAEGECRYETRQVAMRTEMSGDFKNSFLVKISSSTSDATGQQSIVVKRTITQTGTYLGESCGDLKGGEAVAPNGEKISVQ